jgi:hypothetical protein
MGPEELQLIIEALGQAGPNIIPLLWFIVLRPYFEAALVTGVIVSILVWIKNHIIPGE